MDPGTYEECVLEFMIYIKDEVKDNGVAIETGFTINELFVTMRTSHAALIATYMMSCLKQRSSTRATE